MSFDNVTQEIRRREMEEGASNAAAARQRMADQEAAQRDALLCEFAARYVPARPG